MSCALAGAEGLSGLTLAGLGGPWGVPVISSPALTVPPTPGTFYARERVAVLYGFVREALQSDWLPFELLASGGQKLSEDENLAFNECGLVSDKPPLRVLEGQLLAAWARAPHKGSALLRGAVLGAVLGAGRRQAPWASVLPSRLHGVTLRHLVSPCKLGRKVAGVPVRGSEEQNPAGLDTWGFTGEAGGSRRAA